MTVQPIDASIGRPYASLGQRVGAVLVDQVASWVLLIVSYATMGAALATSVASYDPETGSSGAGGGFAIVLFYLGMLASLALGVYQWYGTAVKGQSIGKRVMGISVVDAETAQPIGWGRAFVRYLVLGLLGIPCGLGQLALLFVIPGDSRRQGWHDKAVRSVVIQGTSAGRSTEPTAAPAAQRVADGRIDSEPVPSAGLVTGSAAPSYAGLATGSAVAPPTTASPVQDRSGPSSTPNVAPVPLTPEVAGPVLPPPPGAAPLPSSPVTTPHAAPIDDHTRVPVRTPAPAWRLVGPTTIPLTGTVIVGREPSSSLIAGATTVVVNDAERSMSKTHAALVVSGHTLTVEDLDSTNGVYISRVGVEARLPSRTPTELKAGETVLFGDVAFEVEHSS